MPITPPPKPVSSSSSSNSWLMVIKDPKPTPANSASLTASNSDASSTAETKDNNPTTASLFHYPLAVTTWLGATLLPLFQSRKKLPQLTTSIAPDQEDWEEVTLEKVKEIEQEFKITEEKLAEEKKQREEAKLRLKELKKLPAEDQAKKMSQLLQLEKDLEKSKQEIKNHMLERQRYLEEKIAESEKLIAARELLTHAMQKNLIQAEQLDESKEANETLKKEQIRIEKESEIQQEKLANELLEKNRLIVQKEIENKAEQEKLAQELLLKNQFIKEQQEKLEKLESQALQLRQEEEKNKTATFKQKAKLERLDAKAKLNAQRVIKEREKNEEINREVKRLQNEIKEKKYLQEENKNATTTESTQVAPPKKQSPHHIIEIGQGDKQQLDSALSLTRLYPQRPKKTRQWPWYGIATLSLSSTGLGIAIVIGYSLTIAGVVISGPIGWAGIGISLLVFAISAHQISKARQKDKLAFSDFNKRCAELLAQPDFEDTQTSESNSLIASNLKVTTPLDKRKLLSSRTGVKVKSSDALDEQEEKKFLIEITHIPRKQPELNTPAPEKKSSSTDVNLEEKLQELQNAAKLQQTKINSLEIKASEIEQQKIEIEKQKSELEEREKVLTQQQIELETAKKQWENERLQSADRKPNLTSTHQTGSNNTLEETPLAAVPITPLLVVPTAPLLISSPAPTTSTLAQTNLSSDSSLTNNANLSGGSTLLLAIQAGITLNKAEPNKQNGAGKPRGDLLSDIRSRTVKLKKVEMETVNKNTAQVGETSTATQPQNKTTKDSSTIMGTLFNTLGHLRQQIAVESDSESDSEDWDNEKPSSAKKTNSQ